MLCNVKIKASDYQQCTLLTTLTLTLTLTDCTTSVSAIRSCVHIKRLLKFLKPLSFQYR